MGRALDLTGERFGRLVAIRPTDKRDSQHLVIWEFQCDCGNIVERTGRQVKRGDTQSCGCLRREKLIQRNVDNGKKTNVGDRFGALVVIEDLGFRQQASRNKRERWSKCQCDCGNIIEQRNNNLQSGMAQSCGCINSRGERIIAQILRDNNINFATQYSFSDLRTNKNGVLKFDFAIFKNDKLYKLIEFDGRQHTFGPDAKWKNSDSLEDIQYRDSLKNEYCQNKGIALQRIPYTDIGKITLEYLGLNKRGNENEFEIGFEEKMD